MASKAAFALSLVALGGVVALAVWALAILQIQNWGSFTDCFADFQTKQAATQALADAHAQGLNDTDLIEHRASTSIRITSDETGNDAQDFRRTVRGLVADGGGHMEKNTPCIERGFFD